MKLKKRQLLELNSALNTLMNEKYNPNFTYSVVLILEAIEPEVIAMQKAMQPDDKFIEFKQSEIQLAVEMSEKDDKGHPKMMGQDFIIDPIKKLDFDKKREELKKKYKDAIKKVEDNQKAFEKTLDSDVELNINVVIDWSDLPSAISVPVMKMLKPYIKKPEGEK